MLYYHWPPHPCYIHTARLLAFEFRWFQIKVTLHACKQYMLYVWHSILPCNITNGASLSRWEQQGWSLAVELVVGARGIRQRTQKDAAVRMTTHSHITWGIFRIITHIIEVTWGWWFKNGDVSTVHRSIYWCIYWCIDSCMYYSGFYWKALIKGCRRIIHFTPCGWLNTIKPGPCSQCMTARLN